MLDAARMFKTETFKESVGMKFFHRRTVGHPHPVVQVGICICISLLHSFRVIPLDIQFVWFWYESSCLQGVAACKRAFQTCPQSTITGAVVDFC